MLALRCLPQLAAAAVLAGAVCWLAGLVGDRAALHGELASVRADLARAEAELERAAETARIHRAHLARAADAARRWDALSRDLQLMEGRDAPLSPLLRTAAERLFRP